MPCTCQRTSQPRGGTRRSPPTPRLLAKSEAKETARGWSLSPLATRPLPAQPCACGLSGSGRETGAAAEGLRGPQLPGDSAPGRPRVFQQQTRPSPGPAQTQREVPEASRWEKTCLGNFFKDEGNLSKTMEAFSFISKGNDSTKPKVTVEREECIVL